MIFHWIYFCYPDENTEGFHIVLKWPTDTQEGQSLIGGIVQIVYKSF